jgi:hypothetical protein
VETGRTLSVGCDFAGCEFGKPYIDCRTCVKESAVIAIIAATAQTTSQRRWGALLWEVWEGINRYCCKSMAAS